MDAPENGRVQPGLQLIQCPIVRRPGHRVCYHNDSFIDQRRVDYFLGLHQHEPFADPDRHLLPPALAGLNGVDDALEICRRQREPGRLFRRHAAPRPVEGLLEPVADPPA